MLYSTALRHLQCFLSYPILKSSSQQTITFIRLFKNDVILKYNPDIFHSVSELFSALHYTEP